MGERWSEVALDKKWFNTCCRDQGCKKNNVDQTSHRREKSEKKKTKKKKRIQILEKSLHKASSNASRNEQYKHNSFKREEKEKEKEI